MLACRTPPPVHRLLASEVRFPPRFSSLSDSPLPVPAPQEAPKHTYPPSRNLTQPPHPVYRCGAEAQFSWLPFKCQIGERVRSPVSQPWPRSASPSSFRCHSTFHSRPPPDLLEKAPLDANPAWVAAFPPTSVGRGDSSPAFFKPRWRPTPRICSAFLGAFPQPWAHGPQPTHIIMPPSQGYIPSFPLAHEPTPTDNQEEARRDSVNTIQKMSCPTSIKTLQERGH